MQIQGNVNYISSKERKTRKGPANVYAIKLESDDNWYNTGFKSPGVKEGDEVTFRATEGQYGWEVDASSIEILEKAKQAAAGNVQKAMSKDDYWKSREERDLVTQKVIQLQAARNAAIATCSAALAGGVLALPKTANKQLDAFVAAIDKLTGKYFNELDAEGWVEDGDGMFTQEELDDSQGEE